MAGAVVDVEGLQSLLGATDPAPWWIKGGVGLVAFGLFARTWLSRG